MAKLETDLKEWVSQGLISETQAREIHKYESSKSHTSWILSGLLFLGALIIGIGVISLIAANWSGIPDAVKLVADFAILGILAAAAVHAERTQKAVVFEVLLVSLQLMTLASIGLIAQIYNTGGMLFQALLLWSFITFGIALISRQFFVPFLWTGLLMGALIAAGIETQWAKRQVDLHVESILALVPFFSAAAAVLLARAKASEGLIRSFRWWVIWSAIPVLAMIEFLSEYNSQKIMGAAGFVAAAFSLIVAIDVLLSKQLRHVQKAVMLATLGALLLACNLPMFSGRTNFLQGAATIVVLALGGLFLASLHARGLFQLMVSLVGIRFLILYFQAFGGLATTGVGLILSGVFVIGSAILWNKYRARLAVWAERWTQ